MKTSTQLTLWSFAWLAISFVALSTGAHFAWVAFIVGAVTHAVGSQLARLIENNKKENN